MIGSSISVYPAAGLIHYIPKNCEIFVIDPHLPNAYTETENHFKMSASEGMKLLKETLLKKVK